LKVSILIPLYKAQQWVGAAIPRARVQDYPDIKIVVVVDGSTINKIHRSREQFEPDPELASPLYPLLLRMLGLNAGEQLAASTGPLRRRSVQAAGASR
jgi:hypothetical protein